MLSFIKKLHHTYVFKRRIEVISETINHLLPKVDSILDIGCGDGSISKKIIDKRGDLQITGIDIMERPMCHIEYASFDGKVIPFENNSFDAVQLIDVLHHTNDIKELMQESLSKSKKYVIIKDHIYSNRIDFLTLKFMDWIGNAPHGVEIIYNFQKEKYWINLYEELGLEIVSLERKVKLYPTLFNWIFGRKLHFVVILQKN